MTPNHQQAADAAEKDNCQICHGAKGGVKGNENIVDGVVMCDYCHVASVSPPAASPAQAAEVELPPLQSVRGALCSWASWQRIQLEERERQLRTALTESQRLRQELAKDDDTQAEMAKRIAELENTGKAVYAVSEALLGEKNAAHAKLRAVSEALDGYAEHRPLTSDEIALVAKLRAIVEGK